jgi:hypothetical protein
MGNTTLASLWKTVQSLSATEAAMLGFLLLCAVGGILVAIYVGIRAFIDARQDRRETRAPTSRGVNRQS